MIQFNSLFVPTVTIKAQSRKVTVKGPRGTLVRNFRHLNVELLPVGEKKLRVNVWFAKRKELACVKTICTHIENMIKGVIYVSPTTYSNKIKSVLFSLLDGGYTDLELGAVVNKIGVCISYNLLYFGSHFS